MYFSLRWGTDEEPDEELNSTGVVDEAAESAALGITIAQLRRRKKRLAAKTKPAAAGDASAASDAAPANADKEHDD